MPKVKTHSAEETFALGKQMGECAQPSDLVLLTGELGAGKTQFAKGFAAGLGITDPLTSPTYPLVLIYEGGRIPLNHFDLYRLTSADELVDIDLDYTLQNGGVSLVEWGDRFEELRKSADVEVRLSRDSETDRTLDLHLFTERGTALVDNMRGRISCVPSYQQRQRDA